MSDDSVRLTRRLIGWRWEVWTRGVAYCTPFAVVGTSGWALTRRLARRAAGRSALATGDFMCGAFQPIHQAYALPYRCTEPYGHAGPHKADIDGRTEARWEVLR